MDFITPNATQGWHVQYFGALGLSTTLVSFFQWLIPWWPPKPTNKGVDLVSKVFGLLFAKPSFLGGLATALDLGGTLTEFNDGLTAEQADYLALKADVQVIADDMRQLVRTLNAQRPR
jgi:hypothetical protein